MFHSKFIIPFPQWFNHSFNDFCFSIITLFFTSMSLNHPFVTHSSICHSLIHFSLTHPFFTHSSICHSLIPLSLIHPLVTHSSICHSLIHLSLSHPFVTHSSICHSLSHLSLTHPFVTHSSNCHSLIHLLLSHPFVTHSSICHSLIHLSLTHPFVTHSFICHSLIQLSPIIHLSLFHPVVTHSSSCHSLIHLTLTHPSSLSNPFFILVIFSSTFHPSLYLDFKNPSFIFRFCCIVIKHPFHCFFSFRSTKTLAEVFLVIFSDFSIFTQLSHFFFRKFNYLNVSSYTFNVFIFILFHVSFFVTRF